MMIKNIGVFIIILLLTYTGCSQTPDNDFFVTLKFVKTDTVDNADKLLAYNLINEGIIKYSQNDFEGAITAFDSSVATFQTSIAHANKGSVYYGLAETNNNSFNYLLALKSFNKAIEIDSAQIDYYYNRGLANKDLYKNQDAIDDFEYFISKKTDFAYAYTYLGICYGMQHDLEKALTAFNKSIELNPNIAEFYYNRSVYYSNTGDYTNQKNDLEKALELEPFYKSANHNLGYIYRDHFNNCEKAIYYYTKSLEGDPSDNKSRYQRATCYYQLDKYEKALEDISFLIEILPKEPSLYKARIDIYKALNEPDKAKEDEKKLEDLTN